MRIISRGTLRDYWARPGREDSEDPLKSWFKVAKSATWRSPADVKKQYGNCSPIAGNRVVFNIGGNKYRLVVKFSYRSEPPIAYIRFVGTHAEYDKINVEDC
jgi:mRNA interferase HigB